MPSPCREVFAHGSGSEFKDSRLVLDRLDQGVVRGMILERSVVMGTANGFMLRL